MILEILLGLLVLGLIIFIYNSSVKNKKVLLDLNDLKTQLAISRMDSLAGIQKNQEISKKLQDSAAKNISLTGQYQELYRVAAGQNENINLLNGKINELLERQTDQVKKARLDAVATSKAVIKGKISENLAVLLPNWKWSVADSRFLGGSPLDFIVYQGMSNDLITDIILIDVKTGSAQLTPRQKQIKNAISAGRVSFETVHIDKNIEIISP